MYEFYLGTRKLNALSSFKLGFSFQNNGKSSLSIRLEEEEELPRLYERIFFCDDREIRAAFVVQGVKSRERLLNDVPIIIDLDLIQAEYDLKRIIPTFRLDDCSGEDVADILSVWVGRQYGNYQGVIYEDYLSDIRFPYFANQTGTVFDCLQTVSERSRTHWRLEFQGVPESFSVWLVFDSIASNPYRTLDLSVPFDNLGSFPEPMDFEKYSETSKNTDYQNAELLIAETCSDMVLRKIANNIPKGIIYNPYGGTYTTDWGDDSEQTIITLREGIELDHPIWSVVNYYSGDPWADNIPWVAEESEADQNTLAVYKRGEKTIRLNENYDFSNTNVQWTWSRTYVIYYKRALKGIGYARNENDRRYPEVQKADATDDWLTAGQLQAKAESILASRTFDTQTVKFTGHAYHAEDNLRPFYIGQRYRLVYPLYGLDSIQWLKKMSLSLEISSDKRLKIDFEFSSLNPYYVPDSELNPKSEENEGVGDDTEIASMARWSDDALSLASEDYGVSYDIPLYCGDDTGLPAFIEIMQNYY